MDTPQKKILIIEDDKDIRELTGLFLSESGYDVDVAENGESGLKKVLTYAPDLVICDIAMEGKNGFEVLHMLQQTDILSHTPFIFVTAKTSHEDIRQGMNMGADDYITKPFKLDELLITIQTRLKKAGKSNSSGFSEMKKFVSALNNPALMIRDDKITFVNDKIIKYTQTSPALWLNKEPSEIFDMDSMHYFSDLSQEIQPKDQPELNFNSHFNCRKPLFLNGILRHNHSVTYAFTTPEEEVTPPLPSASKIKLTPREKEVLNLLKEGKKTAEIAKLLHVSAKAIDKHRANLLDKFGVRNTPELITVALTGRDHNHG